MIPQLLQYSALHENVPIKEDSYYFMYYKGRKWIKLFYHDVTNQNVFKDDSEALYHISEDKYSILYLINETNRPNETYKFILRYPGVGGENIFSQVRYPLLEYWNYDSKDFTNVTGLYCESCSWREEFGGIIKTQHYSANTLLHCSNNSDLWHFSIGTKILFYGNIPAFKSAYLKKVELWMEVKINESLLKPKITTTIPIYQLRKELDYRRR